MNHYELFVKGFESELDSIERDHHQELLKSEYCITATKKAISKLRKLVVQEGFDDTNQEVWFFKNIKPRVYSKLIYHMMLFNIESKRPRSSVKAQTKFLYAHIDKLQVFFNENLEFYYYYRRGLIFLDEHYFVRGRENIRLHPDSFHFFTDEQFSTSHDSTVATILAYDMLIVYLKKEIDKLEIKSNMKTTINPFQEQPRMFWTASKTDLVELIYALHSSGAINSGTADIKEMSSAFEHLFNIQLGDFYRTFLEIRSRKINQTKFIDNLKIALLKRMEDSDE